MNRLPIIVLFGMLLILYSTTNELVAQAQTTDGNNEPPNIILLVTDDQRWDALGVYGNDLIQTPNINRMAEEGVLFENMFVTTSICAPSRATIMTGQYPSRHGIRDFRTSLTRKQLQKTYMGHLKKAGYRVGFIGKWGVGTSPDNFLDYDKTFPGQGHYFHEVDGEQHHLTGMMGDQALEFLDQSARGDAPFMLSISFKAAHVQDSYNVSDTLYQYDPALQDLYSDINIPMPEKAADKYYRQLPEFLQNSENRMRWGVRFWGPERAQQSLKGYYRLISGVDREVGRIRQKLDEAGLAENTIIIFTSENGMFMGEYGFTGKWYPHRESLRIPLIIYEPGLEGQKRGRRLTQQALTLDMAPTIVQMAGLDADPAMQGQSLVPLIEGEKVDWRKEFFYEHLFDHPRIPKTEAVRTERWKYIRYVGRQPAYEQLFDLKNDPLEVNNLMLSDGHQSIKEKMREKWEKWHDQVRQ